MMQRSYRRFAPGLVRRLLYPDSFDFKALPSRGISVELDIELPPERVSTPQAPDIGLWPEVSFAAKSSYELPSIFAARLKGAYYNPWLNLVTDKRGAILNDSSSTVLPIDRRAWTKRIIGSVERIEGYCTLFRSVHNNFYHTLIDNIARVFLLRQPCYRILSKIKLLLPGPPTAQEEYLFKRYLPDNVEICLVSPDHYVLPETLIFTSFLTRRTLIWLPRGYLDDMLPNFLPKCPRHRCHRIFIERSEGHRGRLRVIDNQKELVQALAPLGFKSYRLEDLSFDEQISLFYDAEAVVAAHGAGLSNLIFSDCIDVLELHPSHMVIPTYYYLSECMGHSYRYWKGDRKHFEDSFKVDIDGVLGRLPEHLIKTEATQELT